MKTEYSYQREVRFTDRVLNKASEIVVFGVDEFLVVSAWCNGKLYEKLTRVKQYKRLTADEACKKAVNDMADHICDWVHAKHGVIDGCDLYNHDIKSGRTMKGYTLGGYVERCVINEWC